MSKYYSIENQKSSKKRNNFTCIHIIQGESKEMIKNCFSLLLLLHSRTYLEGLISCQNMNSQKKKNIKNTNNLNFKVDSLTILKIK